MAQQANTLMALMTGLSEAASKDSRAEHPSDIPSARFGFHVSQWLRKVAADIAPTNSDSFEQAQEDWQANGSWRYADREAAYRFMYERGYRAGLLRGRRV